MAFNINIGWGNNTNPLSVEQNGNGDWFYTMMSSNVSHSAFVSERQKLNVVLSNPACLKVFALNADLFSLGKVNTESIEDVLYTISKKPNFKQTWTQFLWDYNFFCSLGTAYLWNPNGKQLSDKSPIQWLNPANIVWNATTLEKLRGLIFSDVTLKDVLSGTITYYITPTKTKQIPLSQITPLFDLSSGMNDNFYVGASRLDALYKIISNSELSLDAKSKNLEYSRKFMVNGKNAIEDISSLPMNDGEKASIENSVNSSKSLHAVKTPIEIKRFVDDIARLKLDESFYNDYFMIGSMYGIPRDILEANLKGSTYENQEKSMSRHVEYTMKPKGQNLTDSLKDLFNNIPNDIQMSWEHLAFNQVFEREKQEVLKLRLENEQYAKENKLTI